MGVAAHAHIPRLLVLALEFQLLRVLLAQQRHLLGRKRARQPQRGLPVEQVTPHFEGSLTKHHMAHACSSHVCHRNLIDVEKEEEEEEEEEGGGWRRRRKKRRRRRRRRRIDEGWVMATYQRGSRCKKPGLRVLVLARHEAEMARNQVAVIERQEGRQRQHCSRT